MHAYIMRYFTDAHLIIVCIDSFYLHEKVKETHLELLINIKYSFNKD